MKRMTVGKRLFENWCGYCGKYVVRVVSYSTGKPRPWCLECDQQMTLKEKSFLIREAKRVQCQSARVRSVLPECDRPATLIFEEWMSGLDYWDFRCAICKTESWNMDHWKGVGVGGHGDYTNGTTADNVLPMCNRYNHRKHWDSGWQFLIRIYPESEARAIWFAIQDYFKWTHQPRLLRVGSGGYPERLKAAIERTEISLHFADPSLLPKRKFKKRRWSVKRSR